jgi:predicted Zn-dependent protease
MLQKDRDDLTAWAALSDAELELGNIEPSEKAAQEMLDRKPSLPSYVRASYLKWLRGDEAGALEAIRLAIDAGRGQKDHEPEAWVLSEAANIFWLRGDVEGALAGYEKSLQEKSDEPPALVGKARCLIAQGKAGESVPLLEKAFDETHLVETAWWLAKAHEVQGDSVASDTWLARAIDAGKEGDRRSLALVLATVNRDLDVAKKAIDDDNAHRGGPYADDVAALVAWRAGDMASALQKSADAVKLGTPDPRLWLHRGVILAASGDAKGKKLVADALAKGARFDPAMVALAKEVGVEVAK